MRVINSPRALSHWSKTLRSEGVRVGMVPTMGALHAGHRALIRTARLACDAVVVSLFVNPTQFGPREGFLRYPRRLRADTALCEQEGVDVVYAPTQRAMYPTGYQTIVTVEHLSRRWEGAVRPGHFSGVATVVAKLLCAGQPDIAFFGQKDYQQALVVKQMVEDLNFATRVQMCATVRERDGLALSSRNAYLGHAERRAAPILYAALEAGRLAIRAGTRSVARVNRIMRDRVADEPLARIDYLAVCNPRNLEPLKRIVTQAVLIGAIRLGGVRLIDNVMVRVPTVRKR